MFTRYRIRDLMMAIGVIVIYLAVKPYFHYEFRITDPATTDHVRTNPDDMPFTEDYVFGWSDSPLFSYHNEKTLTVVNGHVIAGRSTRMPIGWISWSSLTLVIGIGLIWLAQRLKPKTAAP